MSARTDTPFAPCAYCGNPAIVHPVNTTGMRCDYFQPMRPAAASPVSESEPATDPKWPLCQCGHTAIDHAMRECVECDCITYDPAPAVSPSGGAPSEEELQQWAAQRADDAGRLAAALLRVRDKYDNLRRAINESARPCEPGCDRYGHDEVCRSGDPTAWLEDQQRALESERAARLVAETRVAKALAALDGEPPDEIVVMLRDQAMDLDRVPAATVAGDLRRAAACIEALAASPDSGDAT